MPPLSVPMLIAVGLFGLAASRAASQPQLSDRQLAVSAAIEEAYPRCPGELADEIVLTADFLGTNPYWLANLVRFETANTFKGSIQNGRSQATGVLQFLPSTARWLGTSTTQLQRMSATKQLRIYGRKYFETVRRKNGRRLSLESEQALFMAVFYPRAMTWPLDQEFPAAVTEANPGIHTPGDYLRLARGGARV